MDEERLRHWLAFASIKGIKRQVLKEILKMAGGPTPVFEEKGGVPKLSLGRGSAGEELLANIRKSVSWRAVDNDLRHMTRHGIKIIALDDEAYPPYLKASADPPFVLYVKGDEGLLDKTVVAVVGTRRASEYGLRMSERIAMGLVRQGVVVVSGMARGCDTSAHRGALSAGGKTIAVLGTGMDTVYPSENKALFDEIARKGLLVTEFPLATGPLPGNFPARNRIISGLSVAVVVVEAPLKSGAMMTASLALGDGRDVFAVPGQAGFKKSEGTNKLIKDGAFLVEDASDILSALNIFNVARGVGAPPSSGEARQAADTSAAGEEGVIIGLLSEGPLHIDDIIEKGGLKVERAGALLVQMELKGWIEERPGKKYHLKRD
ncbi:MAG: DNA-protecting protein DprA, partial [Deltaproteobacteria bacterium]|nr:DNA-protecting protein DprA [Deltaproteobacteria bacterium]